ncbi:PRC-barrel domain-containing protein [Methylocystis echinoides]|uniref:PRC-barrel domain-containing protein n=1 Tax=Methylocystis echinoides TaxID=29468 RepID=UPI003445F56C
MKEFVIPVAFAATALTLSRPIAHAEGEAGGSRAFLKALPADSLLVSNVYAQSVYDATEKKVGKIEDLLLDRGGKAQAAIISVGGFLGIGDKEVAVPFEAIRVIEKGNKSWLEIDASKDALKSAPAVMLDKAKGIWSVKD